MAEGSIIAAIITAQLIANDPSEPRPISMSIPAPELDCQIVQTHATPASARKASAASAGGETSESTAPGCHPRHAGQNPRRRVGLMSLAAVSA
jgi:hypothetical protein